MSMPPGEPYRFAMMNDQGRETLSFHDLERAAWSERAAYYDAHFAAVTGQAVGPMLDGLGDLEGKRILDVACGTGHLVAEAARRGAEPVGTDFASPMIDAARANYPRCTFAVADAARLPFDNESFEHVTCAFGLSHMESPRAAVAEAGRVLRPGGRFAFALWCGPADGGEHHRIVEQALKRHADRDVVLPPSWTSLRYADTTASEALLRLAGFTDPVHRRLAIAWSTRDGEELVGIVDRLSVRTSLVLAAQTIAAQVRIRAQVREDVEARRVDGVITVPWPAILSVARKRDALGARRFP